jgi:hypothetical protein
LFYVCSVLSHLSVGFNGSFPSSPQCLDGHFPSCLTPCPMFLVFLKFL